MTGKTGCAKRLLMVLFVLGALAGGGVLLWRFLPEESKASIQDFVNQTRGDIDDVGLPDNPLSGGDTSSAPNGGYEFIQCATERCCNGLDSICDLPVDQVLFAGVHNAHATRQDGFLLAPNHLRSLEDSLRAGYRAINVDLANCEDGFQLVHGRCSLGTRSPTTVFANILEFLNENPTEVILLTMQIDDEAGISPVRLDDIFNLMYAVPGFTEIMYSKAPDVTEWPSLGELVQANKRLLFFFYNGQESCSEDVCPEGFHDWFAFAAETEFSFATVEEVNDYSQSCAITRGDPSRSDFFGVNAFVTLPSHSASKELNTLASLQTHVEECSNMNSLDVNVVWVDFWGEGDLPKLVQMENANRATR